MTARTITLGALASSAAILLVGCPDVIGGLTAATGTTSGSTTGSTTSTTSETTSGVTSSTTGTATMSQTTTSTTSTGVGGATTSTTTTSTSTTTTSTTTGAGGTMCISAAGDAGWADWRMPNSRDGGLPNPASYDTTMPGVVKDLVTGLSWERDASSNDCGGSGCTQATAADHCAKLTLACASAWRLPTRIELISLLDLTQSPVLIDPVFTGTTATSYWTSSPAAADPAKAWYVDFTANPNYGVQVYYLDAGANNNNHSGITELYRVRCVCR